MLISLIGNRFGEKAEEHLDEIREERANCAKSFIKMGDIKQSDKVLDSGLGCGFGTATIARSVRKVVACDIRHAYLEFACRECANLNNVKFNTITNHRLSPIDSQSLEAVISTAVFIHLNLYDIYHYFNEFSRVLKPDGKVLINFADMNRLFSRIPNRRQDQLFLSCAGFYHDDPNIIAGVMQWN